MEFAKHNLVAVTSDRFSTTLDGLRQYRCDILFRHKGWQPVRKYVNLSAEDLYLVQKGYFPESLELTEADL